MCADLPLFFAPHRSVTLRGKVSYAAQEPFILNASVRENITFGRPFNEALYRKVRTCTQKGRKLSSPLRSFVLKHHRDRIFH